MLSVNFYSSSVFLRFAFCASSQDEGSIFLNFGNIAFMEFMDWFRLADKEFDEHLERYYLIVNDYREPIHPHGIGHFLTKFEDKHGFRHVTCHGLRHTYCSLLLAQNVPIQTVSKYLGHSDSTVTLKVYSHFIPDTQERALNALDKLIP